MMMMMNSIYLLTSGSTAHYSRTCLLFLFFSFFSLFFPSWYLISSDDMNLTTSIQRKRYTLDRVDYCIFWAVEDARAKGRETEKENFYDLIVHTRWRAFR